MIRAVASDRYEPLENLRNMLDNPRKPLTPGKAKELDQSLLSLGLFRPLLVWRGESGTEDPVVIGGNQRLTRLRALVEQGHGIQYADGSGQISGDLIAIPVTTYQGNESEARLVALRDNNSDGEWDWTALSSFTKDLDGRLASLKKTMPDAMKLSGFNAGVLADLSLSLGGTPAPGKAGPDPTKRKTRKLSDTTTGLVTVRIGHMRGKLGTATYKRLVAALAVEADRETGEGLDAAFTSLLDRAGIEAEAGKSISS